MIPFYQNRERKDSDKEVFFMKGYVTACNGMVSGGNALLRQSGICTGKNTGINQTEK